MTKQEIYRQHVVNGIYTCPECKYSHLGGLPIENLNDDDDTLPQVFCRYGCGYIYLPIKKNITQCIESQ